MRNDDDPHWLEYRRRFADVYDDANYDRSLQGWVMRAGHRMLERPFDGRTELNTVVEVGAGTGEHWPYIRHRYQTGLITDADIRALAIAQNKLTQRQVGHALHFVQQDATRLALPDATADRLIAAHVLEHLEKPHRVLKEWKRVLRPGGWLSVLLPTDPGLAWRIGRHLGPRRRLRALGLDYDYIMAREHINACSHLLSLLHHEFPEGSTTWWPTKLPSVDLNLFVAFHARSTAGDHS